MPDPANRSGGRGGTLGRRVLLAAAFLRSERTDEWVCANFVGSPGGQPWLAAPPRPSDPEELLAARFARGEIDEDEYQRRLAVLRETSQPAGPGHQGASR
jgi:Short C-terminal domain